jgi:hypothetical protein
MSFAELNHKARQLTSIESHLGLTSGRWEWHGKRPSSPLTDITGPSGWGRQLRTNWRGLCDGRHVHVADSLTSPGSPPRHARLCASVLRRPGLCRVAPASAWPSGSDHRSAFATDSSAFSLFWLQFFFRLSCLIVLLPTYSQWPQRRSWWRLGHRGMRFPGNPSLRTSRLCLLGCHPSSILSSGAYGSLCSPLPEGLWCLLIGLSIPPCWYGASYFDSPWFSEFVLSMRSISVGGGCCRLRDQEIVVTNT